MSGSLQSRYEALHREMLAHFEYTAVVEKHWLMYILLGWQMLAACAVSQFFLTDLELQVRWPYAVVWLVQIGLALATIKIITGRPQFEESPLEPMNKRIWTMFIFLSINTAVLNVASGHPVFTFLPTLGTLSAFAFTFLTTLVSRRFLWAGIFMFITGIVMARLPNYAFLVYGISWCLLLQAMALIFFRKGTQSAQSTPRHPVLSLHQPDSSQAISA